MITRDEITEIKNNTRLAQAAGVLMALFTRYGLTPSHDLESIRAEYKVNLFSNLLQVDKALKMRFELARVEAAKLRLIEETIDLTGYDELQEIAGAIESYRGALNSAMPALLDVTQEQVIAGGCDLAATLEPLVVTEILQDHDIYKSLVLIEGIVNDMLASGKLPLVSHKRPFDVLRGIIATDWESNRVAIDQVRAFQFIKSEY